jgi:hypothetical protein
MNDEELAGKVHALRQQGQSPKQIARTLGVRPATIAPLIRAIATQDQADAAEPGITGCWVSPGWSDGLTIEGHSEWPGAGVSASGTAGLVSVLVAREETGRKVPGAGSKVSVCAWMVDVYCLGVKNCLGPDLIPGSALPRYTSDFFSAYDGRPLAAPLELARQLVFGAVDFARGLGFEPPRDFGKTTGHLGPWGGPSVIGFGQEGKPLYIQGPYDNVSKIMKTLEHTAGRNNFHFLAQA